MSCKQNSTILLINLSQVALSTPSIFPHMTWQWKKLTKSKMKATLTKKKDDSDVAAGVIYGGASFCELVIIYYVIPKWALQKLEGPQRPLPPFKKWTPWTAPYLPQGKFTLHRKSPNRNVNHPSTIYSSLRWVIFRFSMESWFRPWI